MKYSSLGKTGLNVSRLSFGASALGGVYGKVDEAEGIRAVHTALDLGINYFDVSPAYGGTRAETVLGKALKGISRERYFLSTKVGKHTNPDCYGEDKFDYSRLGIRASLEESARRLGVDYFDIFHIHDIEYQHRQHTEWALTEGVESLLELKKEGQIGNVSFGIYPMDLWHRIFRELPIDAALVHNHHTLIDTLALELLPAAKQKGIGIINGSPFGSGLLSGREAPDWHPATAKDRRLLREAAEFCSSRGVPISKLALQFSSQNHEFPTTLFSSTRPESVRRNVAWYEEPFDHDLLTAVKRILAPLMNKQWDYDAPMDRSKVAFKPNRLPISDPVQQGFGSSALASAEARNQAIGRFPEFI
jgi:aryl-alcohol dehydrogenase-like predicted oxidoreductase